MRFDGYSNFGQAHDTGATTPAVAHPAPATDAAGNDVWNIWTGDDLNPTATTYSYAECIRVADALAAAGHKVFTDAI